MFNFDGTTCLHVTCARWHGDQIARSISIRIFITCGVSAHVSYLWETGDSYKHRPGFATISFRLPSVTLTYFRTINPRYVFTFS